jgi:hypothetical protein
MSQCSSSAESKHKTNTKTASILISDRANSSFLKSFGWPQAACRQPSLSYPPPFRRQARRRGNARPPPAKAPLRVPPSHHHHILQVTARDLSHATEDPRETRDGNLARCNTSQIWPPFGRTATRNPDAPYGGSPVPPKPQTIKSAAIRRHQPREETNPYPSTIEMASVSVTSGPAFECKRNLAEDKPEMNSPVSTPGF